MLPLALASTAMAQESLNYWFVRIGISDVSATTLRGEFASVQDVVAYYKGKSGSDIRADDARLSRSDSAKLAVACAPAESQQSG
jgi:hypothetical protein